MSFSVNRCWCVMLLLVSIALSGCLPSAPSQADEEKELHFLEGRSRVNALDYAGAIESFEKALEANPQSASAHFELGWLYDQKEPDAATAIYHYQKYLALRPKAENAESVKERILACKQEIARGVSLGPVTEKQQRDLDKLAEENRQLTDQVKQLNDELGKWRAYSGRPSPPTNSPTYAPDQQRFGQSSEVTQRDAGSDDSVSASKSRGDRTGGSSPATRTYVVKSGDTLSLIARKTGVRLEALKAANPRLDPRRIRPGQTLNLP